MSLTVVCLVDRRRNVLCRGLASAGITVVESFTTDQAVAVCVSKHVDAVVLDQEFFVEVDGWSVAQSIKLVKPTICVLLATRAQFLSSRVPRGVDAVHASSDTKGIIAELHKMTNAEARYPGRNEA